MRSETRTAVAMQTIDQLSTYIHVYVDNYQNNEYEYDKEIMILFLSLIKYLPLYGKSSIWRVDEYGNIPA